MIKGVDRKHSLVVKVHSVILHSEHISSLGSLLMDLITVKHVKSSRIYPSDLQLKNIINDAEE